jgi:hypothetical protein
MPLRRDLLLVTDCNAMNCFAGETGATGVADPDACSPNAADPRKTTAKKVSVESSEEGGFI